MMKRGVTKRSQNSADKNKAARQAAYAAARNIQLPVKQNPSNRGLIPRGPEVKALDVPLTLVTLSTTGTVTLLNGIQEGTSFFNRVGRRIEMKSLHFVGNLDTTGNAAGVDDYIRIMIIYDQQPTGTNPASTEFLQDVDNAGTLTTTSYSGLNLNFRDRFTILMDHRIGVARDGGSSTDGVTEIAGGSTTENSNTSQFNRYIRMRGLLTQYKQTANPAAIGDITTGALYLFTLGKIAVGTAGYNLAFKTRLRFADS